VAQDEVWRHDRNYAVPAWAVDYEVGDRVRRETDWGDVEYGEVTRIFGGVAVDAIEVLTEDDEAYGEYDPRDWSKA